MGIQLHDAHKYHNWDFLLRCLKGENAQKGMPVVGGSAMLHMGVCQPRFDGQKLYAFSRLGDILNKWHLPTTP